MPPIDAGTVIQVGTAAWPLVKDILEWIQQRHADTGTFPTEAEVRARMMKRIGSGLLDMDAWDAAHPDEKPAQAPAAKAKAKATGKLKPR